MHRFVLSLLGLLFSVSSFSQILHPPCFYRHYTGTLDNNMKLTVDLSSDQGVVSGFYYYSFPEPGNPDVYHFGKTIPLNGTLENNTLVLSEYANEEPSFTGQFTEKGKISGTWKKPGEDKSIPFAVVEDNQSGSLSFTCFPLSDERLMRPETQTSASDPKATISINLLYPQLFKGDPLQDSIDFAITGFLLNEPKSINSPQLFLENMAFDFFDSYHIATDGIVDVSNSASFNWEKNVAVQVLYNENNILSLRMKKYASTGGVHGINMIENVVFQTASKSMLGLDDIFKPGYKKELDELLDQKLRKLNGIQDEENLRDAGFFIDHVEASDNFYVNNDGIGFFYNIYEIAPFSSGVTELFLTFYECSVILKDNHSFGWVE